MQTNYTPLDLKKFGIKKPRQPVTVDTILVAIIFLTIVVLGILVFMLLQKQGII
ncbi:MAG: hypothetical protein N2691_00370 [Patescibacteria group bacterium]|nr:hypothetical protein [Patescibacteria group bacterium]